MSSSVQAGTDSAYGGYAGPAYGGFGFRASASSPAVAAVAASSPTVTAAAE